MRILCVSPRQCLPANTGAKLRDYWIARSLGEAFEVTYVFFADPKSPPQRLSDLPFCREVVGIPRPATYTPWKLARGVLGRWPLPVINYQSPEMANALRRITAGRRFDVIHLDSLQTASYAPALARAPGSPALTWNWHNIESQGMERFAEQALSPAKRSYARWTAAALRRVERWMLEAGSGHLVCSAREADALNAIVPTARIALIENGVDAEAFAGLREASRTRILFVGSMNYHANVDGAVRFTRDVWPGLRGRFPQLRLTLVGANPTPEVLALGREPGVDVTGTVPDVRPYYAEAAAAVVPIRVGAGTRLKVLEAMAAGVPVVSTTLGAEGLAVTPGRDILIADEDTEWLPALSRVVDDAALRRRLTASARSLVRDRYDWAVIGRRLAEAYREWFGDPIGNGANPIGERSAGSRRIPTSL